MTAPQFFTMPDANVMIALDQITTVFEMSALNMSMGRGADGHYQRMTQLSVTTKSGERYHDRFLRLKDFTDFCAKVAGEK